MKSSTLPGLGGVWKSLRRLRLRLRLFGLVTTSRVERCFDLRYVTLKHGADKARVEHAALKSGDTGGARLFSSRLSGAFVTVPDRPRHLPSGTTGEESNVVSRMLGPTEYRSPSKSMRGEMERRPVSLAVVFSISPNNGLFGTTRPFSPKTPKTSDGTLDDFGS